MPVIAGARGLVNAKYLNSLSQRNNNSNKSNKTNETNIRFLVVYLPIEKELSNIRMKERSNSTGQIVNCDWEEEEVLYNTSKIEGIIFYMIFNMLIYHLFVKFF
jgi:hypothetical protein